MQCPVTGTEIGVPSAREHTNAIGINISADLSRNDLKRAETLSPLYLKTEAGPYTKTLSLRSFQATNNVQKNNLFS
jgi:hypothetical protein